MPLQAIGQRHAACVYGAPLGSVAPDRLQDACVRATAEHISSVFLSGW